MRKRDAVQPDGRAQLEQVLGVPLAVLKKLSPRERRMVLVAAAAIAERRKTHPNAAMVLINATDVAGGSVKALLKRVNDLRRGKPIEWTVDFCDGSPPETIRTSFDAAERGAPGRPRHSVTADEVHRMRDRFPENTYHQLAARLTAETSRPVSKDLVRKRLAEKKMRKNPDVRVLSAAEKTRRT